MSRAGWQAADGRLQITVIVNMASPCRGSFLVCSAFFCRPVPDIMWPILYNRMNLNGLLQSHLAEIDTIAVWRMEGMIPEIPEMAASEGIDENLTSADQME